MTTELTPDRAFRIAGTFRYHTGMKTELRDYPLTSTIIKLKTGRVQLTLIEEPDWFLEKLSREDDQGKLYLPYWTYLWESSIGLAHHIEKIGTRLKDTHILEIGCGFGLAGIVACQMGCTRGFHGRSTDGAPLRTSQRRAERCQPTCRFRPDGLEHPLLQP